MTSLPWYIPFEGGNLFLAQGGSDPVVDPRDARFVEEAELAGMGKSLACEVAEYIRSHSLICGKSRTPSGVSVWVERPERVFVFTKKVVGRGEQILYKLTIEFFSAALFVRGTCRLGGKMIGPISAEEYMKNLTSIFQRVQGVPNLLQLEEQRRSEGKWQLLTRYYRKGTLMEVLLAGGLSQEAKLKFQEQLIFAVERLHALGIPHRDIKPHNIFVDEEAVLGDFGYAGPEGLPDGGSLRYLPPEFLRQVEGACPFKRDVWALGLVLYMIEYGSFPLSMGFEKLCVQLQSFEVFALGLERLGLKRPESEAPSIEKILYRALRPNPEERSDAAELKRLFDEMIEIRSDS